MEAPRQQGLPPLTRALKGAARPSRPQPADRNRQPPTRSRAPERRPSIDRYFTVRQVAEFLAYSKKQIRRLCEQGKIRTVQASKRGHHRIALSALREFLKQDQAYWANQSNREFEREVLASIGELPRSSNSATS